MDPRKVRTHDAVMQAAADLLMEQGPEGLTVDGVVARSGVAKSTVYRHWATRDDLVAAVFADCAPRLDPPDPGLPFEQALRSVTAHVAEVLNDDHWKRLLPALLVLKVQMGAIAELEGEMQRQQTDVIFDVFRRGVDEGVLRADALDDLGATMTLLVGPLLMASLVDLVPLDDAFADLVAQRFLAAHRVDAPPGGPSEN